MAADPLYEERNLALTSVECDPLSRSEVPDVLPTPVEVPCDPQGVPLPEEFLPVSAPAAPVPAPEEPPSLPIRNRPFTAVCLPPRIAGPDSPVSYTVPAPLAHPPGALERGTTSLFRPAEINALTASQSAYITTSLQDPVRKAAVAAFLWDTIQDEDDMAALLDAFLPITGWSSALSTIVITAALAQQDELSTTAQLLAESFLDCGFYNPLVTVCCDDTRPIGYAITVPAQSPVQTPPPDTDCATTAADTFFSLSSQVEATATAVAAAARELDCIYYNALVEVSCESLSPEIFGPPEEARAHPVIIAGGGSMDLRDMHLHEFAVVGFTAPVKLVYYATTPASTVVAASQAEADAIAYQMALAELNCFFPSDWLEVDCTTEFPAFTARADDGIGKEATLDEVTYEGITTRQNDVFTSTVEPVTVDELKTVAVTSPTGAFISTTTQSAATDSAEQYAISLLECLWRSPGVTCACYEPVTPGQDVYFYDEVGMQNALDTAPGLIVFNAAKSANNHEIPEGSFVTPDFPSSDISAVDPWATAGLDAICLSYLSCVFCNVRIEPECTVIYREVNGEVETVDLADLPGQTLPLTIPEEYEEYTISPTFKAGLLPEIVCNTDPGSVGSQADSLARLKPGSADTICIYGNPETFVTCLTFLEAQGRESEFSDLTEASRLRNVTVPANSFSAGGASEQEAITAAINAAIAYGLSLLQCEFGNNPLTGECPGEYDVTLSTVGEVDAEEFKSPISKADANRQAQIYVALGTVCAYVNERLEQPCVPKERPRTTKATDNCGCRHTYRCKADVVCPDGEILAEGDDHTICIDREVYMETQPSVVEAGVIVSYISTEAANATAAGLLNIVPCQWCNREVTVQCCDLNLPGYTRSGDGVYESDDGYKDDIIPSEDAILEVTVDECEFTTEIECDATEQAFRIAVAQLFCEYEFPCVREKRPRIIEALDNCNVPHAFLCGFEVGGADEPFGPPVDPVLGCRAQPPKCLWVNLPIDVYCLEPPDVGADGWSEDAVRAINIPEGEFVGATMCDATEQAFNIAVSQLFCEYEFPCVRERRPRIIDALDNCGSLHTLRCGTEVGGQDEPDGPPVDPSLGCRAQPQKCLWVNLPVDVYCDPPPPEADGWADEAVIEIHIPEGEFVGATMCDATEQAFRIAVAQLFCEYEFPCVRERRPRILKASDNCGSLHTFLCGTEVGGADEPDGPSVDPVIGCRAQPPKCLWVNLPVDVRCCGADVEGNVPSSYTSADVTTPEGGFGENVCRAPASPTGGSEGQLVFSNSVQEVHIPEGEFVGSTMCDATEQAFRMAVAQLFCEYTNTEQTAECELKDGDHFHPDAVISVTVAANTLIGCQSTAEYNKLAMDMAMAQLECLYGNDYQEGGCSISANPRVLKGADNCGGQHTELCGDEVGGADEEMGAFDVPFIVRDFVASPKSTAAANALARALLEIEPCVWFNNEVKVECENKGIEHPDAVLRVTIQQGTITAGTMCDATEQAFRTAVAQLQCLWTNERQEVADCPDGFQLVEGGEGIVEADTLIQCSTATANAIALAMAKAQVQCEPTLFGNAMATSTKCPHDELPEDQRRWELETSGVCLAGEIQSTTQETADAIAESLAKMRTVCKPIYRCNPETAEGDITKCPLKDPDGHPQGDRDVCHQEYVGGETICAYGFLASELQTIAQTIADAATYCCPEIFYNQESAEGPTTCANGTEPCEWGHVGSLQIWSLESEEAAQELAQKLANEKTFCCPKTYFNPAAVTGYKTCADGICVFGEVPAGAIPSWIDEADATAIAQGIANALTVCCPPGGGGELPDADQGDMLYWDATAEAWVLLEAPEAPGSGKRWVVHHDGIEPDWVEYDELQILICGPQGPPTEYTILGIPTPPTP